jgi:cyclopropane fatty-acyl-phospholipid synthase-like methyltransferase
MLDKSPEQLVKRYYDLNTGKFLFFARQALPKALHQPLYEHKGMSYEDALHTHHRKILGLMPDCPESLKILDLGCGVGESMIYLANNTPHPVEYYGITLSEIQAKQASSRVKAAGLEHRVKVIEGSFQSLPPRIPKVDLAFSIEAFVHSPDPIVFFTQVASIMRPQSRLVLFDDFLMKTPGTQKERRIVNDLRQGWLANSLLTPAQVFDIAFMAGLERVAHVNASPMLKLQRPRDRFVCLLVPFARVLSTQSQYCRFLIGGDSRQRAYRSGLLEYAMLVFEKKLE